MPANVAINIAKVRERIGRACRAAGRAESDVTLIAVSKTQPDSAIRAAHNAGLSDIGENYCQEAIEKIAMLDGLPLTWHFIGPLQSNKTRPIAERFAWVHSVDRLKLAQRLSAQRPSEMPPLNVCVQVNIDDEASKSGIAPEALSSLLEAVIELPHLRVRGLMAIPKPHANPSDQREAFIKMRVLFEQQRQRWPQLDTLSMGMSDDFELAIEAGATMIRVGTDIFGARAGSKES
jgi:pyridoxal phosphate enzyme (YggS family)